MTQTAPKTRHPAWSIDSWRDRPLEPGFHYDDAPAVDAAVAHIRQLPPLVTSGEIQRLRGLIAQAQRGERFLLQGGDCAERFADCRPDAITGKLKILLQVSLVLLHASKRPVIRIGRWAGQYAKPRSSPTQTRVIAGEPATLPSYYGDLVNTEEFTAAARRPDPARLIRGYEHAAITLNFIRSLIDGGFGDLHHPEWWELGFLKRAGLPDELRREYGKMMEGMLEWLAELEDRSGQPRPTDNGHTNTANGHARTTTPPRSSRAGLVEEVERVEFFSSHEGLNLWYESAQTRRVPRRDGWFDLTTHLPWIGERSRGLGGAHVEFFRGIQNPIAVKVGPRVADEPGGLDELLQVLHRLNPANDPGKLVLITRLGAPRVREVLPRLVERVARAGRLVLWVCDPMHGNTRTGRTAASVKTRHFADIVEEVQAAWEVLDDLGQRLGGLHIEVTGEDVTECVGGASGVRETDLTTRYHTACDPRLNYEQAMELAFVVGRKMGSAGRPTGSRTT